MDLDQEEEHWINVEWTDKEIDNDLSIFTVGRTSTTPISVQLSIDTQPLVMERHGCSCINRIRGTTPQEAT